MLTSTSCEEPFWNFDCDLVIVVVLVVSMFGAKFVPKTYDSTQQTNSQKANRSIPVLEIMVAPTVKRRRHTDLLTRVVATIFQNRFALVALNVFALIFLISRNQTEFNDYYDLGVSQLNTVSDSIYSSVSSSCKTTGAAYASTTTVIQENEPDLHETATVMAMATGYDLLDYQRFVGSLRKTGFMGNIILVVSPKIEEPEETYLLEKNVIMHKAQYVNCSHPVNEDLLKKGNLGGHEKELITCVHPYPKLKHRWARFPLLRDLLLECGGQPNPEIKCGGPVLITDMRDTFFQRNPFGPEAPKVYGLQVFEEHYSIRTTHWLVDWPVKDCKGVQYNEPMLCSGTTIGTRQAMLDYLRIFEGEMNVWMESPKCCCFETNGDDQSMHNYMYYSGMLDGVTGGVTAVKNRDGLVNTVGAMGSLIGQTHHREKNKLRKATNHSKPTDGHDDPYDLSVEEVDELGDDNKNWLGLHYGMTDRDGYFTQFDGSRSFVVHQWDRFGHKFNNWLDEYRDDIYYP